MTQKYRTTIRETQNLNSWSVGLGPAFILSTTWWTWVRKHWSAFLIKALRYNYQFCSRWIITELVGGHRASKSGSTDSRQKFFVSNKVKWMGQCVPLFPIIYTHLHIINSRLRESWLYNCRKEYSCDYSNVAVNYVYKYLLGNDVQQC